MKKLNLLCILICLIIATIAGCGKVDQVGLKYPDRPTVSDAQNSWEQWDENDKVTIKWYVDLAGWNNQASSKISKTIYEKTGVNIMFQTPANSDGSKLSTMMQTNTFTDVITIAANTQERIKLVETGDYIYSIQELAKRWAPTLLTRLNNEMVEMYKASDGNLYGIPNHFYATDEVKKFNDMGHSLLSNGGIVARKDYLDEYVKAMKTENSNFEESSICCPSGVLDMCLWVKNQYNLRNDNPTVCLAPFESHRTTGSVGLRWLMEYFAVPEEDENGNYVYQYAQPEFEEMMVWLNELFRKGLVTDGSIAATSSQIGSYIQKGLPFIYIGSPQDMAGYFKNWALGHENQKYVPIVFGNSKGIVPQISVTGNSYMFSMITNKCVRPDRVIQLFDYLYSDEGQRLIAYGIEGKDKNDEDGTFYYKVKPGEKAVVNGTEIVYEYGQIDYTDKVKEAFNSGNTAAYGFFSPNVLYRPMFVYLSSANAGVFNTYVNYIAYNLKAGLIPYTYSYRPFEFELNPNREGYNDIVNIQNNLRLLWNEYYAEIICSPNETTAREILYETLHSAERKGYKKFIEYKNIDFQKHKKDLNIKFAWPINDPNSEYHNLKFNSIYGDFNYELSIPDDIVRR